MSQSAPPSPAAPAGAFTLELAAPVFPATDLPRSLRYYTEALLFTVAFKWSDAGDENWTYAILRHGRAELHLAKRPAARPANACIFVAGVNAYYTAVARAGATIVADIADYASQMREFEASDPDDNRLIFGEHLSRIRA